MSHLATPCALVVTLAALGCSAGQDDLAGAATSTTAAGAGGAGGAASTGAGGQPPLVEPDGAPKLTVVNGVVDQPAIQLCFLESPSAAADLAAPWPASPLEFATASVATMGGPVPEGVDVELVLLAGDLGSIGALSCRALVDDLALAPDVSRVSLGIVPTDALVMPRSLVFVPTGCTGGEGHEDASAEVACGIGYTKDDPSLGVVFAPMSRIADPERLGLQFVHAATGGALELSVLPPFDGAVATLVAEEVVPGQAAPYPPSFAFAAADLGGPSGSQILAYGFQAGGQPHAELFGEAMTRGGLSAGDFVNGASVAFVAVGATPGLASGSWWNDFAWVALRSDP